MDQKDDVDMIQTRKAALSKRQSKHSNETKNSKTDDHRNQLEVIETPGTQEKHKTKNKQTGVKVNTEKKGSKMQENSTADITQNLSKTQGSKNILPGSDVRDQAYDSKGYERETKSNEEALKLTAKTNQNPALSKNTEKNQNETSSSSSTNDDDSDEKDNEDMIKTRKAAILAKTKGKNKGVEAKPEKRTRKSKKGSESNEE